MSNQQYFRTLTTTDTLPSSVGQQLNGTVTTDLLNADHLIYSGTSDLEAILNRVQLGFEGSMWAYVPTATVPLAKVLGREPTGTNQWAILLDRVMAGVSAANIFWVVGDIKKYQITNQGGAAGVVDGQSLSAAGIVKDEIKLGFKTDFLDVLYLDATGTSFLIQENR